MFDEIECTPTAPYSPDPPSDLAAAIGTASGIGVTLNDTSTVFANTMGASVSLTGVVRI